MISLTSIIKKIGEKKMMDEEQIIEWEKQRTRNSYYLKELTRLENKIERTEADIWRMISDLQKSMEKK